MNAGALDALPPWVRSKVAALGLEDADAWAVRPLPVLGGRSVVEAAEDPGAESLLRQVLDRMATGFPTGG